MGQHKMYVRMKAYFDSVEIREYQHTSGNRIASQAKGFTASRVEWLDASGNVTDNINDVDIKKWIKKARPELNEIIWAKKENRLPRQIKITDPLKLKMRLNLHS